MLTAAHISTSLSYALFHISSLGSPFHPVLAVWTNYPFISITGSLGHISWSSGSCRCQLLPKIDLRVYIKCAYQGTCMHMLIMWSHGYECTFSDGVRLLNLCLFFPPAVLNWKDTARAKAILIFIWKSFHCLFLLLSIMVQLPVLKLRIMISCKQIRLLLSLRVVHVPLCRY